MTNILLVEDDRAIIENLSAVLKAEGFQVRAEAGQREALAALQEENLICCCWTCPCRMEMGSRCARR